MGERASKRRWDGGSIGLALVCCVLGACASGGGEPEQSYGAEARSGAERLSTGDRRSQAIDLSGPVATPAHATATVESRVRVAVEPIGDIPFDAQVLPIISPDGRFAATCTGEPPSWPTLLSQVGQHAPRSTLHLFDLTASPVREIVPPTPLPNGLVLGRDADGAGVLVESPRPDGSRWIGRVNWATGALTWLVRDDRVNAHAVFTPDGGLAWSRRDADGTASSIVVRTGGGAETEIAPPREASTNALGFPTFGPSGDVLFFFRFADRLLELQAVSLRDGKPGTVVARRVVARSSRGALAYQAVAPVQNRFGAGVGSWEGVRGLVYLSPTSGRMVLYDIDSGSVTPLAPGSIGAAPADTPAPSVYLTTPQGLSHQIVEMPSGSRGAGRFPRALPPAKVLADPFVPRATTDPARPIILVGPAASGLRDRVQLTALRAVE